MLLVFVFGLTVLGWVQYKIYRKFLRYRNSYLYLTFVCFFVSEILCFSLENDVVC